MQAIGVEQLGLCGLVLFVDYHEFGLGGSMFCLLTHELGFRRGLVGPVLFFHPEELVFRCLMFGVDPEELRIRSLFLMIDPEELEFRNLVFVADSEELLFRSPVFVIDPE